MRPATPRRIVLAAALLLALAAGGAGAAWWWSRPPARVAVLVADGTRDLVVMDFARPFALDPPPPGWWHRRFWFRAPMRMSFVTKDDVPALRVETNASASMLFRRVDAPLADYPTLAWRWLVEQPVDSPRDERTREGDDHPARLFVAFRDERGDDHRMEIIWGNRLRAGEIKVIGTFPHYVADGGGENIGVWRAASVDLAALYRRFWPDAPAAARITDIALFCDTDDTGTRSIAYFADVVLRRAGPR